MSRDNGIYILKTFDSYQTIDSKKTIIDGSGRIAAYRVAHVSAIDNFSQLEYEENLTDLHKYMKDNWGQSAVYCTIEDALICASKIYDSVKYLEYGINKIDGSNYDFFYTEDRKYNTWEVRILKEEYELTNKLSKLDDFISNNPNFLNLPQKERYLLRRQFQFMSKYAEILQKRIDLF